jgi:transposase InsO family protein
MEPEEPAWAGRAAELLRADSFTAAELVALEVPGWPASRFRMREFLKKQGLKPFLRVRQGGRAEVYLTTAFPRGLRAELARRIMAFLPLGGATGGAALPANDGALTRSQQQLLAATPRRATRAETRAVAVRAFEAWSAAVGLQGRRAADRFSELWEAGAIEVPDWVTEALPALSAPSLLRWQQRLAAEGAIALAGDYKPRLSTIDADPALRTAAEGLIYRHPHAKGSDLRDTLRAVCNDGRDLPSYRACCRWLADWKAKRRQLHQHLLNPDAHRGRFMPAFGDAAAGIERPNQLWEMDSTPGDAMLRVADRKVRHTVIGVVDVHTRRKLLLVWPTSNSEGIALLIRRAILEWGVPEAIKTDNGADYTSRAVSRVLADLGVSHKLTRPFSPEEKPHIERALGAFSHGLVELLPGFAGHNVAEAQALRERQTFASRLMSRGEVADCPLSPEEFQRFCDRWSGEYHFRRPHAGLGNRTPEEVMRAWTGPLRRVADERALDLLLAPVVGLRTVTKKGIRLDRGTYIAAALGSLVGEQVECRHDPADLGRIYVFTTEGAFVAIAEDPERTGIDRRAVAQAAKAVARRGVSEQRARLKEAAKALPKGAALAEAILDAAAPAPNVVAFPRAAAPHSTPAIEQLGRAARAGEAMPPAERSAEEAARAAWVAEKAKRRAAEAAEDSADAQRGARIKRGLAVMDALLAGAAVEPAEAAWFEGYRELGEFRVALRLQGLDPDDIPATA